MNDVRSGAITCFKSPKSSPPGTYSNKMYLQKSAIAYQKSAPQVKAICEKYGVPYVKQNVFKRLKKTVDIMVGNTSMKWFPESYEKAYLEKDAIIESANYKKSK